MWFRNLQIYRLSPAWDFPSERLAPALQRGAILGAGATDRVAHGWLPPRGVQDEWVFAVQRQQLIALGVEQRLLPAGVVRQYAQEKLAAIEAAQGYRAGKKQVREVVEQVELELLPRAFIKRSRIPVWIDPVNRWLAVDAPSSPRGDEVLEQLRLSLDDLPVALIKTALSPGAAMTQWLAEGAAPRRFAIDLDCELRATDEARAAVRYVRHSLDCDDVRAHIAAGKTATRLALTWNDRVSFVLTEQLQIKRLVFLDVLKEEVERQVDNADELFAASFILMCGELSQLLQELLEALGGELE